MNFHYFVTFSEQICQEKSFRNCLGHIFHILCLRAATRATLGNSFSYILEKTYVKDNIRSKVQSLAHRFSSFKNIYFPEYSTTVSVGTFLFSIFFTLRYVTKGLTKLNH